ncbi:hypothetical protein USB125703_00372 [Pseudoclavibacter triregionum]|nr:hypothetical protein USB125703_00372 [Pseudoclavibacter triregionum]
MFAASVGEVDRDELLTLLTPESMRLLGELGPLDAKADILRLVARLRGEGHPPERVAAVVAQAALRRKASAKLGPFAERMLFTEAGLQQATRLRVAAHHAERFRAAGVTRIADLGCGIGADAMAFASLGFDVRAVDADEATAAIAAHNLAIFPNARVEHARAEEVALEDGEAAWLDPARRAEGRGGQARRSWDPADWMPSLDFAFGLGDARPLGVKLGPGVPHEALPADGEAQWVSEQGEVVEATVWRGATAREGVGRSALVLGRGRADELAAPGPAADAELGELGEYLHEPDGAVIRAELIGLLAERLGARMLAPEIAWMTSDAPADSPFAASFRVREVLPLDAAKLKRAMRERGIGTLEIKKRGVDVDPAELRKRLALRGDGSATLVLTRIGDRRRAILADRVADEAAS